MSRGVHRGVYSVLVDDLDFQKLSPRTRHVFLTLRLSKEVGPACIFVFYPEVVGRQTGYTARQVEAAMVELEQSPDSEHPWVRREGPLVWLRNGLLHDPTMTLANENHLKSVARWIDGLPRVNLVLTFCEYYKIGRPSGWPVNGITPPALSEYPGTQVPSTQVPSADAMRGLVDAIGPAPGALSVEDGKFLESLPEPYRGQWRAASEWWISLTDGYPDVNLQREASKYMAYHDALAPGQKHKNVRMGFRRWVAKAARWREDDRMRKAVRR